MTFDDFIRDELAALLRFAGVLAGNRADAEDLMQDVLLGTYRRWPTIGQLDRPSAYVRKMVLNAFLSQRRKSRRQVLTADVPDIRPVADHAIQSTDRAQLVEQLARLPRRQRAVIVLRFCGGMSDAEIATELGCGASTVRAHASRALATLRVIQSAAEYHFDDSRLASRERSEARTVSESDRCQEA
ncbi:MAG: SigE family RNA polymerase sigma factor [Nakamurella sp.]